MRNLTVFIFAVFLSPPSWGQEYVEMLKHKEITFEYKWEKMNLLKQDSPYIMKLRITNQSIEPALVRFELLYYKNLILHSRSGEKEYCLNPGQIISGRTWGLAFQYDIGTLKEIHDRDNSWEINLISLDEGSNCETGLKLRLVPACL